MIRDGFKDGIKGLAKGLASPGISLASTIFAKERFASVGNGELTNIT